MRFTMIEYLGNIIFIFAQIIYCVCSLKLNPRGHFGKHPLKMFYFKLFSFFSFIIVWWNDTLLLQLIHCIFILSLMVSQSYPLKTEKP